VDRRKAREYLDLAAESGSEEAKEEIKRHF
jgi:hypothetical protein